MELAKALSNGSMHGAGLTTSSTADDGMQLEPVGVFSNRPYYYDPSKA